jgi:hypothetical protein
MSKVCVGSFAPIPTLPSFLTIIAFERAFSSPLPTINSGVDEVTDGGEEVA